MNENWFFQPVTFSRGKLILLFAILIILCCLVLIWMYYEWYVVGFDESIQRLHEN